jgi:hypothetical protein
MPVSPTARNSLLSSPAQAGDPVHTDLFVSG